jgi:DNA or RNA helicases of superfamily II
MNPLLLELYLAASITKRAELIKSMSAETIKSLCAELDPKEMAFVMGVLNGDCSVPIKAPEPVAVIPEPVAVIPEPIKPMTQAPEPVKPVPVEEEQEDEGIEKDLTEPLKKTKLILADRSLPTYAVKKEAFSKYMAEHREHQVRAINATKKANIGQVCIPTGTGKTRIQVHLHVLDMLEKAEKKETGVYVITAHRIALCKQLLEDFINLVATCRLPFDCIFVSSGVLDEDDIYEKHMIEEISKENTHFYQTTRQDAVREAVDRAKNEGRHVILVSTYHSLAHLKLLDKIDLITYDEAHTIASSRHNDENFEGHVKTIQDLDIVQRQYFFTATRKVCGDDDGMNNKEIYGEVLYEEPIINMIHAGEIVPPRIHHIKTVQFGEFKNDKMIIKTIVDAFSRHKQALQTASPLSGNLGAKLLVSAEGSPEINAIQESSKFKVWCFKNKIKLFTFSSEYGFYMFKEGVWTKVTRNVIFDGMQALPDSEDAILIHIDILAEGIDLPSITGVLPFRELNLIKLFQTIGRASRLLKDDRKQLYSGKVKPMEWDKMIKPYSWLILADLDPDSIDSNIKMEASIEKVYATPTLHFSEDKCKGPGDPPWPESGTEVDPPPDTDKETDLIHTIEELMIGGAVPEYKVLAEQLGAIADPSLKL